MPFDFYAELISCKNPGSLYYVEAWEYEVLIQQSILEIFDEPDWKLINELYTSSRDKCKTMDELWLLLHKDILPLIVNQALLREGYLKEVVKLWTPGGSIDTLKWQFTNILKSLGTGITE